MKRYGNLCARAGKKLELNKAGEIISDPKINDLTWREPRKGWGPLEMKVQAQNKRVFLGFNAMGSVILSGHNFSVPAGWLVELVHKVSASSIPAHPIYA